METFSCPTCGASLDSVHISGERVTCPWCGSSVIVPETLRPPVSFQGSVQTPARATGLPRAIYIFLGVVLLIVLISILAPVLLTSFIFSQVNKQVKQVNVGGPVARPSLSRPTASPSPVGPTTILTFGGEGTGPGLFQDAQEIAVDGSGNIYVSDETRRIQKFDATGKFLNLWAIAVKGAEKLDSGPERLVADHAGNVYAAIGSAVLKYNADGEYLGAVHGTDFIHDAVVMADGGMMIVSSKDGDDELVHLGPNGKAMKRVHRFVSTVIGKQIPVEALRVAVDGLGNTFALYALGHVYGEHWYDSSDLSVYKFTPDGRYSNKFGGGGDAPGQFKLPVAIAVDNQSRVYVSDEFNSIKIFADDGRYIETIKTPHTVSGMAFDMENNLYIVGSNKISKLRLSN